MKRLAEWLGYVQKTCDAVAEWEGAANRSVLSPELDVIERSIGMAVLGVVGAYDRHFAAVRRKRFLALADRIGPLKGGILATSKL